MKLLQRLFWLNFVRSEADKFNQLWCPICGEALKGHTQCGSCGILIGKYHHEPIISAVRNGKNICSWCDFNKY